MYIYTHIYQNTHKHSNQKPSSPTTKANQLFINKQYIIILRALFPALSVNEMFVQNCGC